MRRKKGFGIPRYYLGDVGPGMPFQEHVLQRLFLDDDCKIAMTERHTPQSMAKDRVS